MLIVTDEFCEKSFLASRNLKDVMLVQTEQLNVYTLLKFDNVVFTKDAIQKLEDRLK